MRSEWRQGGIDRRDLRATKDDPEPRAATARKDTRRWCRGKVGRTHTLVVQVDPKAGLRSVCAPPSGVMARWCSGCRHQEVCTACGKVLRSSLPAEECPVLGAGPTGPSPAG